MSNETERGKLKIFLGYAPGVGKTYTMLREANEMHENGEDVVIGYLETHGRAETEQQIGNLFIVPRKEIEYKGRRLEELDKEAVLKLYPKFVLIDELAHTNIPECKNTKRYEDVVEILEAGINVISTLNIQHLESINDVVERITEVKIRETIPDSVLSLADEIVLVDLTPDALINRLLRGKIYKKDVITNALENFFRKGNLTALREIALMEMSLGASKLVQNVDDDFNVTQFRENEFIVVCVSSNPLGINLIRRGSRIAKTYKCNWVVVAVDCTHRFAPTPSENDNKILEGHKKLALSLGGEFTMLKGKSISGELSKFIKTSNATQVIIGKSRRTKLQTLVRGSTISKLLKFTRNVEYHIIPY
ncbi:sensor histidine kinase KdpD [Clostridium folliculivorans]|uniref:Signal transduction histidine kinase osmosensitive K+ channel sensor N-terminal domain-containing protein n=1 Tax=Clostridium folliculivorans TaxID=2886038 RepID=A0A9W6D942_9CLOT|nr:sensor histidine kinase KdpD [Clostridium folliculivorans]GKU23744.1 hypothetical protein CFOLD11_05700 [Clostridium folliculivorans]GKU29860.1 hypothetical protein CFB3_19670 [Clostridium folliculivorans]